MPSTVTHWVIIINKLAQQVWHWLRRGSAALGEPQTLVVSEHGIEHSQISDQALFVISELQKAGFDGYLVGGCVRDLLMGITPKDFDVSTNARPEQIKKIFRHCRLIGRRFRLAHVVFGREVIEVATYRKANKRGRCNQFRINQKGVVVSDNNYGKIEDDVMRRDFTVNALYYDPTTHVITDYLGGVHDLVNGQFRMIGDPEVRYREDPVRMLRAIRLMTKLALLPSEETSAPIKRLAHFLDEISATRLFEELLKMLYGGKALESVKLMHDYQILPYVLPILAKQWQTKKQLSKLATLALSNTDDRIHKGMSINPAFLLSVLLWESLLQYEQKYLKRKHRPATAFRMAMDTVLSEQMQATTIPKRITMMMRDIWRMQFPLQYHRQKQAFVLVKHKRFRAAYDFMLLRAESGEQVGEAAEWWTRFQEVETAIQKVMMDACESIKAKKKKAKRVAVE